MAARGALPVARGARGQRESPETNQDMQALQDVALRLDYMVGQITVEELAWQEANFDRDSALGRELLFLIADNQWVRATSETIDITRSDTIDTTITIDLDLDRITHEAFRDRPGQLSLPILVLPPLRHQRPEQDPFSTLTVSDASGNPLAMLPNADVRHRIAAALTEIIVNVEAWLPDAGHIVFNATREHRLLLSAAIYRLLRSEHVPGAVMDRTVPPRPAASAPLPRLGRVRQELGDMLERYSDLLAADTVHDGEAAAHDGEAAAGDLAFVRRLTQRAITILRALAESAVVVVSADRAQTPAVLTVKVPGRALHEAPARSVTLAGPVTAGARRWAGPGTWRWLRPRNWILPGASLEIDLLLPSADADRRVQVNLPDGVSPDPSVPVPTRAQLDIRTERPLPTGQLAELTAQLTRASQDWPMPLCQCLADLAGAKADAVRESLRDHRAGASPGEPSIIRSESTAETGRFRRRLDTLSAVLGEISAGGLTAAARTKLADAWNGHDGTGRKDRDDRGKAGAWLQIPMQRRTTTDTISPDMVVARSRMIEDVSQRAAPTEARMQVHIAVTNSEYFTTSQFSGCMSALLMLVVLVFFAVGAAAGMDGSKVSAEVLAFVLTLFSAFQIGRIERPDRSTIRGLLAPAGNPLVVTSILPTVVLAVAFAFSRDARYAIVAALACICSQLLLVRFWYLMQQRAFIRGRQETASARPRPGRILYTDAPDYAHTDVLHSGWWRKTTADALMVGRQAYGYVVWQHKTPRTLGSLLHEGRPANPPRLSVWRRGLRAHPANDPSGTEPVTGGTGHDPPDGAGPDAPEGAMSPLEQPANVLALQSAGTGGQSLTFAVFRDEPKADWGTPGDVTPVSLDPGRLVPAEDISGVIGVFVGLRQGNGLLPIGEHPLTEVLRHAAGHRLVVLEVQLPFPAPDAAYADVQWARVQLGLHDRDMKLLTPFLSEIHQLVTPGDDGPDAGLVMGVQTVAEGIPRILNPRHPALNPGPHAGPAEDARKSAPLVMASDLDVVNRSGMAGRESASSKSWRVMAIGADWHSGVEKQILGGLDADLDLAGLTYAILHGKAVLLLLAHRRARPRSLVTPGRRASRAAGESPAPSAGETHYLDRWQSRLDLGTAERCPLLRVRMRTPDRPGATLDVLESLRETLLAKAPESVREHDLKVWYARVVVAHGNVAQIQLTVRLPVDSGITWGSAEFSQIERQALARAAHRMAAGRDSAGSDAGPYAPEDTVIRVGLVDMLEMAQPPGPGNGSAAGDADPGPGTLTPG
jgi:hypothetical protein